MPKYVYPAMPVPADVWYTLDKLPPRTQPDRETTCSISPIQPADWFQGTGGLGDAIATHIIRTAPDSSVGDNSGYYTAKTLFPCTVYEIPAGSEHWYAVVWYHEVGKGFSNHHARIYVTRVNPFDNPNTPLFTGWV